MSSFVSRYDINGKSIVPDIYYGVENGTIRLQATEISDGRRLDHYAQQYYGDGMNYWIIAAASGIRWPLGIGIGAGNKDSSFEKSTILFIPVLDDILKLKSRA
jgi:hypothetical protein